MENLDLRAARATAQAIFRAGMRSADPAAAVRAALADVAPPIGRRVMLALGKAGCAMAEAALAHFSPDNLPAQVLVVTDDGNARPVAGAEVLAAGHPVPDARGAAAAQRVIEMLRGLDASDQVLVLLSGGGSALLPAPVEGVSLADKIAVNRLLLAAGTDIQETNLVRQALSRLKGGGLARLAAPAQVVTLILSDVMGDDPRVIASGPTAAPIGTRAEARALLQARGLWNDLPKAVRHHLDLPQDMPAPPPPAPPHNVLIGSNAQALQAMAAEARRTALPVYTAPAPLTGDVRAAAARILAAAAQHSRPAILLWGGETTVHLSRWAGLGGRNQELALRTALQAEAVRAGGWCLLSGGTDGRDGPTDAAGAVVDAQSLGQVRAAGVDPAAAAAMNDAYRALQSSGDLLLTGASGTNVADLQVMVLLP